MKCEQPSLPREETIFAFSGERRERQEKAGKKGRWMFSFAGAPPRCGIEEHFDARPHTPAVGRDPLARAI